MKFVLIIIFTVYRGGGATTAEFNTLEACEQARQEILSETNRTTFNHIRCYPKGEE